MAITSLWRFNMNNVNKKVLSIEKKNMNKAKNDAVCEER